MIGQLGIRATALATTSALPAELNFTGTTKKHLDVMVVECSGLTIHDQARNFRDAAVVIGPHGAGLVNAVFSRSPKFVVDLYHTQRAEFFHRMADSLAYRYMAIAGTKQTESETWRPDNGDFIVDTAHVLDAVESALSCQ